MSAITKDDVEIVLENRNIDVFGGVRVASMPTIKFGGGGGQYSTGGIPLPDKAKFGLKTKIDRLFIMDPHDSKYFFRYDPDNHKIKALFYEEIGGEIQDLGEIPNETELGETELLALVIGQ